jgi:acyl carrier protein
MEQQLAAIFRAVFDLAEGHDVRTVRQVNHPAWDSLAHVSLVGAMESEFGIEVDVSDSMEITSFDAALAYLEAHTG